MSKESKYHPIDVRYRGPSTAYRGSAHRKEKFAKAPMKAKTSTPPEAPVAATAGPWAQKARTVATPWGAGKASAPRPPAPPQPQRPTRRRGLSRLQWFLLILGLYLLLSNLPLLQGGIFDFGSTQINSR